MTRTTGQNPGHSSEAPAGYTWADYVAALVQTHGTLTAVAWAFLDRSDQPHDATSVERAIRRLRGRGQHDGGTWGSRLLRVFGLPTSVEAQIRWMGLYHSPFHDLPLSLCLSQLRVWDRPPVATSRARTWIHLGLAGCALRARNVAAAQGHLERAHASLTGLPATYDAARIESALVAAYSASRMDGAKVTVLLDQAESLLAGRAALDPVDACCFQARIADQRAFVLNRLGTAEGHARALALYEALPADDVHPFASYRRDAGLAYGYLRTGRREEALACAERACRHAGDGGYIRLRAMGLLMQVKILGRAAGGDALARARTIARRLEDTELLARVERAGDPARDTR